MTRRRIWPIIKRVWITVGISATVIFVVWSLIAYRASPEARAAIVSDTVVAMRRDDGVWRFTPRNGAPVHAPALVFFAGALVDPVAYAPLARSVAQAGFPAFVVELPRRGAFGGAEDPELWQRLARVVEGPDAPASWVVAGHSRGGVVASQVAGGRHKGLVGLILVGTSHPRDVDLSTIDLEVTKIVGTRDGLASRPEVEQNAHLLPAQTRWVWIDGGNHSQFGWYGFQPGDRRATIDAAEQRAQMLRATIDQLRRVQAPHDGSPVTAPPVDLG